MKVYRDLTIRGAPNDLRSLVEAIEANLATSETGWARDRAEENRPDFLPRTRLYCFTCDERVGREGGVLFLFLNEQHSTLDVTNIRPTKKGQLSYDEYNRILQDFHDRFVGPLAGKHGARGKLSDEDEAITKWVSEDAAKKLQRFSVLANKSTGSGHPCDEERWYEFLLAAHVEDSKLDPSYLRRWLQEEEGWSEDEAWTLAIEYEQARSLLAYYDAHRGN